MQDKIKQHILFSNTITVNQFDRLSKLLRKYPYSLNLQYKSIETKILLDKQVDKKEYKRLSTYSIDKPFFKLKFKNIHKNGLNYIDTLHAKSANDQSANLPTEANQKDSNKPKSIDKPATEANLITDNPVKQDVNEQNNMMAPENNNKKVADQAPQESHFNDWLEGLEKSKRLKKEDIDSSSKEKSEVKKSKSKKKKNKKKAKKKYNKYVEFGTKQDEIISETLAELMAKQGYTDKAIEMYNRLSLLFPDKNAYFARKIEDLRN